MPAWAKKLLEAHNKSEKRLQRLESELKARPRSDKPGRAKSSQPEFKDERNKVQYELNAKVLEKLEEAADASDEKECTEALDEGKKLLLERNKPIMLAKKYGWEAVDCYIQEPLACDSDDEKCIKRAMKENKALKLESKKPSKPRSQLSARPQQPYNSQQNSPMPRRVVIPASRPKVELGPSESCFRWGRSGHFARNCRAPIPVSSAGKTF